MYLLNRLSYWAQKTPDADALVFEDEAVSFSEFHRNVQSFAARLADEFGVKAGDRVAYLGLNHPNMLYLVFACAHLGAIFAPFNTRLAEDEYRFLIENSEPKLCFYDGAFAQVAASIHAETGTFVGVEELQVLLKTNNVPPVHTDTDDALLLVYTSGTTGRPKGVLLSQRAVASTIENGNAVYKFASGQNVLITLPLFHVGGMCILLLPALSEGATVHLHSRFDPVATLNCLQYNNITTTILVPAQMAAIMGHPNWEEAEFPSMQYVVVGSSLIPMGQIQAWHGKNIPVSQVYGATETGPTAIILDPSEALSHEGSAGRAALQCSIEVRRADGSICGAGENGDIWVKGPNILTGYWRNQSETDLVLQDGWYNTGDIGHADEDGFYWIVDRSKDVIISGGENIYPAEIENIALQHPAIQAIAVVGRTDDIWGETPVAAIELTSDSTMNEAEFQNFLAKKIAKFKQPKSFVFFASLPRNGMGKIEKSKVREVVNSTV